MIDLIQSLHISWFHAQHLRMIEILSFLWLGNALHLHQAHFQFLRVHLKTLRNLHFQQVVRMYSIDIHLQSQLLL
jgi:hypothetical protein